MQIYTKHTSNIGRTLNDVNESYFFLWFSLIIRPFSAGNEASWNGKTNAQIEEKSHAMLGASVYSSGNDGIMVVRNR